MRLTVKRFCRTVVSLATSAVVSSCIAVGPDFLTPAPPQNAGYSRAPLVGTGSVPGPTGAAQRFEFGGDLPEQWWRVFRSSDLNKLIGEALRNNPNLQSTMSTLRATKEAVYAQQGKYFPVAQGNFFASRQQTPASLTPIPASGATVFDLYTAQVLVTYMMDVWGLNRRTVESLQAQSDMQRFNRRGGVSLSHRERGGRGNSGGVAARADRCDQADHRHQHQDARRSASATGSGLRQSERCRRTGGGACPGSGNAAAAAESNWPCNAIC